MRGNVDVFLFYIAIDRHFSNLLGFKPSGPTQRPSLSLPSSPSFPFIPPLSLLSPPLSILHSPPHSPIGLINEQVWPLLFSHYDPATLRLIDNSPLVARSSRLHYKSQGQGQSGGLPAAGQSGGNQLRGRHPERGNKARRLGNQGDGEGLCVLDCRLLIMDGGKRGERCSVTRAMLKRVAGGPSSQSALIFG